MLNCSSCRLCCAFYFVLGKLLLSTLHSLRNLTLHNTVLESFSADELRMVDFCGSSALSPLIIIVFNVIYCSPDIYYGPFIKLAADIQELAICCLYYFSYIDSLLLQSLISCCLCKYRRIQIFFIATIVYFMCSYNILCCH